MLIAQNLPYPSFAGVDLRNWQNVNALMDIGDVGVFGLCSQDPRVNGSPSGPVFYRCSTDPKLGYSPSADQKLTRRPWLLEPLGHPSDTYFTDRAAAELTDLLIHFNPEVVILEELWLHRYIDIVKAHPCEVILDCHNVEASLSKEIGDLACGNDLRSKLAGKILPERVRKIEQNAISKVDQIWVCSRIDASLIESLYHPAAPIHVVPNGIDLNYYARCERRPDAKTDSSLKRTKSILFPAMFAYPPNRRAAAFLIEDLFPRLIEMYPDAELVLAGNWPTTEMLQVAAQEPRVHVTGPVPDMRPYLFAASAVVVPLFQGGGTRFKILEAFAAGVPVISTPKGAEGLEVEGERDLLIAHNTQEFIECLGRLWTSDLLVNQLKKNGMEVVRQNYSWDVVKRRVSLSVSSSAKSKELERRILC